MITSQAEYQVTRRAAERLERALEADESAVAHLPAAARELLRRSVAGQLQDLRHQLAEYEARDASASTRPVERVTSALPARSPRQSTPAPRSHRGH
jgi:hypothetical protein